ncbi:MAG TPA: hypothetical protein VEA80_04155 [Vitreimonas sp.]|uniref:hypothetical protein n=1 Tax=Vitreimonas sp. TaxID=3069702 RepID=UPI002D6C0540|nr:hypothetical protein [Vitreimonas sp.]HYD86644.1 hypothetical protein [Vitreimonas sp.]
MSYRSLDPRHIVKTIERLQERIDSRFPGAGLSRVCGELLATAHQSSGHAAKLAERNWPLRITVGVILALGVAAQFAAAKLLHLERFEANISLLGSLEAAVNLLILFGGAAWFLLTLEERFKRQQALDALHELRSLAHVIDMHQLTKDPTALVQERAPPRAMTAFQLTRYLDYCAEMLALIGKLAALYAERVRDPVVIEAVTEIENLTTGLARKIWQKVSLIGELEEGKHG